jgi:hypothetical protein
MRSSSMALLLLLLVVVVVGKGDGAKTLLTLFFLEPMCVPFGRAVAVAVGNGNVNDFSPAPLQKSHSLPRNAPGTVLYSKRS